MGFQNQNFQLKTGLKSSLIKSATAQHRFLKFGGKLDVFENAMQSSINYNRVSTSQSRSNSRSIQGANDV